MRSRWRCGTGARDAAVAVLHDVSRYAAAASRLLMLLFLTLHRKIWVRVGARTSPTPPGRAPRVVRRQAEGVEPAGVLES